MRITLYDNMAKMSLTYNGHGLTTRGVQPSQLQGVGIGPTRQRKSDACIWTVVWTHWMKKLDKWIVMAAGEGMKFNVLYDGEARRLKCVKKTGRLFWGFQSPAALITILLFWIRLRLVTPQAVHKYQVQQGWGDSEDQEFGGGHDQIGADEQLW